MAERPASETRSLSDDTPSSGSEEPRDGEDFPVVSRNNYAIGEEFAHGGSGRLFRARDRRLDRVVAIKEPRELSSRVEQRFRREALLTARLQHPSIVPIHEIGRWPTGEPFYAMKLISGRSLRDVVAETTSLAQRIALVPNVLAVADAVAYAHSEGVIHRDLKPSNVMVGAFGETQVIDWGLAKALTEREELDPQGSSGPRAAGPRARNEQETGIAGTPSSMAPEQAAGKAADERTDVYGVGSILYHVLAGSPPYAGDDSAKVLEALLREAPPPLVVRAPGVPRELAAIVERAMERDPARRYPSARELAADLRRFLAGQLVAAHDYTWWQLSSRFVRRNRVVLAVAGLSLAALALFGEVSVRRILVERRIAVASELRAETQRSKLLLSQARLWLDRDPTVALAWLKEYATTRDTDAKAITALAAEARARGVASQRVRDRRKATLAPDGVTLAAQLGDSLVVWKTDDATPRRLDAVETALDALLFSTDGATLYAAEGRAVRSYAVATGTKRDLFRADETVRQLVLAGKQLVGVGEHGTLWVVELDASGASPRTRARALEGNEDGKWSLLASHDGAVLFTATRNRSLAIQMRLWHLPSGESETLPGKPVWPALSDDGARVAWGDDDGVIHVYDVAGRTTRDLRGHHDGVRQVVFSADGRKLASSSADRTVRVWDLASGRSEVLEGHTDWTLLVQFAPDGRLLASTSLDKTVRVWDLATGDSQVLLGYVNSLDLLRFTPDSRRLVTADTQGEVRVWPAEHATDRTLARNDQVSGLRFLPDDRLVAADVHGLGLWDPGTGAGALTADPGANNILAVTPDGSLVAQGSDADGQLRVHDLRSGSSRRFPGHKGQIQDISLTRDGALAVTAGEDRSVRLWNTRTGDVRVLGEHSAPVWHVAFSPDERSVVSAGDDLSLRLWGLRDGAPEPARNRELAGHAGIVYDVAFSPDGRWIASAGVDTTVRLWPVSGGEARVFRGHGGLVHQLAFSPDGGTLATASDDRTVRLWDTSSGSARVLDHDAAVEVVRFARDGQSLVSGTSDGVVRVWDAAGGLRSILRGRSAETIDVALSNDSRWVGVVGSDGTIRVWSGITSAARAVVSPADLAEISSVTIVGEEAISP